MSVNPVAAVGAGCPWPVDAACFEDAWDNYDDDVKTRSVMFASLTLRRLTGYRVGGCPVTVRPCKASCWGGYLPSFYVMQGAYGSFAGYWPHINEAGYWVNSCGHAQDCSCSALCEVELPGPVGRVDAVKVDGVAVVPSKYRADGNRLVWTDPGACPWPICQDLSKPDTVSGTFSVTYLNGYPVDSIGAYAAGVLANEYAKACTGGQCRLPTGVTSIARQGVSFTVASGAFPGGLTGIREVDGFIAMWNPKGKTEGPRVWSPDVRAPRVMG